MHFVGPGRHVTGTARHLHLGSRGGGLGESAGLQMYQVRLHERDSDQLCLHIWCRWSGIEGAVGLDLAVRNSLFLEMSD